MRRVLGTLLLLLSVIAARPLRAQDSTTPTMTPSYVPEYTLKQHRFLSPTYVSTPFVSTNVRFQQGLYMFSIPNLPITERRTFDVSAAGLTERISAGIRFLDLFQIYALLQAQVLAGTNAKSVILSGTTYTYSFGGGLAARLFRSENSGTQLSVRAQVTTGPLGQLDLLAFANDVINRDATSISDLFDGGFARSSLASGTETVFRAHAVAAQTISRHFGIQAMLGLSGYWDNVTVYDPADEQDKKTDANSFSPEGGLSVDATLLPNVPLGFNIEYVFEAHRRDFSDSDGAQETQVVHTVAAGIHVVDPRFQAGLTVGTTLGLDPVKRTTLIRNMTLASDTPKAVYGQLSLQYLW